MSPRGIRRFAGRKPPIGDEAVKRQAFVLPEEREARSVTKCLPRSQHASIQPECQAFLSCNGTEAAMTILDPRTGELVTIDLSPRPRR